MSFLAHICNIYLAGDRRRQPSNRESGTVSELSCEVTRISDLLYHTVMHSFVSLISRQNAIEHVHLPEKEHQPYVGYTCHCKIPSPNLFK